MSTLSASITTAISTTTTTGARSHASQQEWLSLFGILGIDFVDPAGVRLLSVSEGLLGIIGSFKQDIARGWVDVLSGAGAMPSSPHPLLSILSRSLSNFVRYDQLLSQEEEWRLELVALMKDLLDSDNVSLGVGDLGTAKKLLDLIGQTCLRRVRPDFCVGLSRTAIRIARDAATVDPSLVVRDPINQFIKTRSVEVPFEASMALLSQHYFSYLFAELKAANGSAGEGRIQVTTACYISLHILRALARLAKKADPQEFRPPPPGSVLSRAYGLQTEAGGKSWRLSVMRASDDWEAWGEPSSFKVGTLWRGDLTDPLGLLEFCIIVQSLQLQAPERLDYIGNWLWCLRNTAASPRAPATKAKRKRHDPGRDRGGDADTAAGHGEVAGGSTAGGSGAGGAGAGGAGAGAGGAVSGQHRDQQYSKTSCEALTVPRSNARQLVVPQQLSAWLRKLSASRHGKADKARVREWVESVSIGTVDELSVTEESRSEQSSSSSSLAGPAGHHA